MKRAFLISIGSIFSWTFMLLTGTIASSSPNSNFSEPLSNTSWHFVEFQSMDDGIGTKRPGDPSLYTMFEYRKNKRPFHPRPTVLDCC